jgi:hypothetical protein
MYFLHIASLYDIFFLTNLPQTFSSRALAAPLLRLLSSSGGDATDATRRVPTMRRADTFLELSGFCLQAKGFSLAGERSFAYKRKVFCL